MSLMKAFPEILEAGKREYENMQAGTFSLIEEVLPSAICKDGQGAAQWKNRLALGENGAFMKALLCNENMAGSIQMVYIDPPFFSKASYDAVVRLEGAAEDGGTLQTKYLAYEDVWNQGIGAYLTMLAARLMLIRDLLREDGTVWVHLDWHAVHYVRLLMDEIFGAEHFVNEIIWTYKSGGSGKKHFARKHDTILVYSKTKDYYFQPLKEKSYNRGFKPYRFKGVEEFQDETGWYTMVNMKDVWQIDMVGRTSSERNGYATQKPEALLERILECSSREGDICADFFCGSGTTAAVAQKMNRRWICCDQGELAAASVQKRILSILEEDGTEKYGEGFRFQEAAEMPQEESLNAEWTEQVDAAGGSIRWGVSLQNFKLPADAENLLEPENRRMFRKLYQTSPLNLLDQWSVDWDYDGRVHRPQTMILRDKKGKMETVCERTTPAGQPDQAVSVMAFDVLGNRYQCVLGPASESEFQKESRETK